MDSCCNDYTLFFDVYFVWNSVGNCEVLTSVTGNRSAQSISGNIIQLPGLNFAQMFREIGITVWLRVCKIHDIIVILKSVRKRKGEVAALITRLVLSPVVVLVVAKIVTASVPALNWDLVFNFF